MKKNTVIKYNLPKVIEPKERKGKENYIILLWSPIPSNPFGLARCRRGKEAEKNMDSSSLVSVLDSLAC